MLQRYSWPGLWRRVNVSLVQITQTALSPLTTWLRYTRSGGSMRRLKTCMRERLTFAKRPCPRTTPRWHTHSNTWPCSTNAEWDACWNFSIFFVAQLVALCIYVQYGHVCCIGEAGKGCTTVWAFSGNQGKEFWAKTPQCGYSAGQPGCDLLPTGEHVHMLFSVSVIKSSAFILYCLHIFAKSPLKYLCLCRRNTVMHCLYMNEHLKCMRIVWGARTHGLERH